MSAKSKSKILREMLVEAYFIFEFSFSLLKSLSIMFLWTNIMYFLFIDFTFKTLKNILNDKQRIYNFFF